MPDDKERTREVPAVVVEGEADRGFVRRLGCYFSSMPDDKERTREVPAVVVEGEADRGFVRRLWRRGMDTPCGKETLAYSVGGWLVPWLVVYGGTGNFNLAFKVGMVGYTTVFFGYLLHCSMKTERSRQRQKIVKEILDERKFGDVPTSRPTGS
uniref:Cytochrome c oxidase assembly protein COX20, mitochondrial n=1 Tax=Plectus sambesii TaxID=2011161 RepID=A0A914VD10_9BILA